MGAHLVHIIGRDFVFNNTRFPLSGAQDFQLRRFPLSRAPDFNCPACCAPLRSHQVNILSSDHPSVWSSDHLIAVEFYRIIIIIDRVLLIKSPRGMWIGRSQRGKFRPQIHHPLIDWHKAWCPVPTFKDYQYKYSFLDLNSCCCNHLQINILPYSHQYKILSPVFEQILFRSPHLMW